ncbi:MAG: ECF transporter S component [Verrucomicrobiota bacterium]
MNAAMTWSLGALIFLGVTAFFFERSKMTARQLSLIMVLGTLAGIGRIPFAALPSLQPTTFMVIMSGFVFGPLNGFVVAVVSVLISNSFLGHGTWTLWQMLAWSLCGMSFGFLGVKWPRLSLKIMALMGLAWGFLFGWITNIWHWLAFVYPLTWESWLTTNALSLWFDVQHGLVNTALIWFLGNWCIKLLRKYRQKLNIHPKS